MNIKNKIAAASASAVILSGVLSNAAFASTNVTISGNMKKSENKAIVKHAKVTAVFQGNIQTVNTVVNSSASTGGNKANDNMGDVTVKSGNATSKVTVLVGGGTNVASLPCGCEEGTTDVKIKDNGRKSTNTVVHKSLDMTIVGQGNVAVVGTGVGSSAETGGNKANGTGNKGTVEVESKDAKSTVDVVVEGGTNVLE